jgi:ComF family protein
VHRLKFHGRYAVARALAPLMADGWARFALEADLLIPVPAHRGRERQRGYNQAALLAEALAEHLSLPVRPEALRRVRATPSQVGLDHLARRANVQGAFQADPRWIAGRRVAVIDDVCTSGATLEACAAALYQAGAVAVWGFTLARVIRQRSLSIPLGGAYGADRAGTEH